MSTMRVWRMPMHLSSGHVTDAGEILPPPPNFPQSDLGRRADSRWALPQISSLFFSTAVFVQVACGLCLHVQLVSARLNTRLTGLH